MRKDYQIGLRNISNELKSLGYSNVERVLNNRDPAQMARELIAEKYPELLAKPNPAGPSGQGSVE